MSEMQKAETLSAVINMLPFKQSFIFNPLKVSVIQVRNVFALMSFKYMIQENKIVENTVST